MNELESDKDIYRTMVASILDVAIFMIDVNGHIVNWNTGAERLTGYQATEIVGQHFSLLYPPVDARGGKPERELATAAKKGRFEEQGWRVRKDGTRYWAHVVVIAMTNEAGDFLGFVTLTRDLTEQKVALDELRRSREKFQRAIESAPNAMMMVNRSGRIEMLNLQAESIFGYSRDELLGQPVEILIPERYRKQHPRHRLFFYADPQTRSMGGGRDLYGLTKDGVEFPVEIGINPIETDEGTMVLTAIIDITDRKLKEEALARSEERFRLAVESSPAAMVIVSREGKIVMVNRQLEVLFGYPRDELLGKSIEMLIPERLRSDHSKFRASFFSDLQQRAMGAGRELYGVRKDGVEIPVEIGLNPIETEEGVMVLAAIIGLYERKEKEGQFRSVLKY
jgi:PAS domain S-box-containing protein